MRTPRDGELSPGERALLDPDLSALAGRTAAVVRAELGYGTGAPRLFDYALTR